MNKIKEKISQVFYANLAFVKGYLPSLFRYLLISIFLFSSGIIGGYYFFDIFPSESEKILSLLSETFKPILAMPSFVQILFIFLRNGLISFLMIIFGILFGIFPIIVLISNGQILGLLLGWLVPRYNISYILLGILPHGLIEIPCFLLSAAIGLKIGKILVKKIFRKKVSLQEELNLGLSFFLRIILFLLFAAAVIEVLISPELLRIY